MWTDDVRTKEYGGPAGRDRRPSSRRACAPRDHPRSGELVRRDRRRGGRGRCRRALSDVVATQVGPARALRRRGPRLASRAHVVKHCVSGGREEALDRGREVGLRRHRRRGGDPGARSHRRAPGGGGSGQGRIAYAPRPCLSSASITSRATSARGSARSPSRRLSAAPRAGGVEAATSSSGSTRRAVLLTELGDHSQDDAAGEAFDKVAKLLGLGYPGGASPSTAGAGRQSGGGQLSPAR